MTIKINKHIAGYEVVKPEEEVGCQDAAAEEKEARHSAKVIRMTEKIMRPEGMESLEGSTYKIKTPLDDHAMYVTINDIILNQGTEHEQRRPFEIFINSKNMDHFQWIVALTRLMSAVFRKGGDVTFLAEELQAVFDPKGGYFKPGGRFMPSIIAEIGDVIAHHMQKIGLMEKEELSEQQKLILDQKRAEAESAQQKTQLIQPERKPDTPPRPPCATSVIPRPWWLWIIVRPACRAVTPSAGKGRCRRIACHACS